MEKPCKATLKATSLNLTPRCLKRQRRNRIHIPPTAHEADAKTAQEPSVTKTLALQQACGPPEIRSSLGTWGGPRRATLNMTKLPV